MKQRIFALLLAAALCLSLVPAVFSADEASGTCGDGLTWTLNELGVLTVSGEGKMDFSEQPWAEQQDNITSVVIQDGVTSVCDSAFTGCTALTAVTLPDTLTEIGDWAFSECSALWEFSVGKNLTSIGYGAFAFCKSLESFHVDAQNASYYSDEQGVLYNKEMTVLICAPAKLAGDHTVPEGVQKLDYAAFAYCTGMTSIDLPASLTSILSETFTGCDSLRSFRVAGENKFYASDDRGVLFDKNMATIRRCPPAMDGTYRVSDNITDISYRAFDGCKRLTRVIVPAVVQSLGERAFYNCTGLTGVYFYGNAPLCLKRNTAFLTCDPATGEETVLPGLTVYHLAEMTGWNGTQWQGCPLAEWDGTVVCLHEHSKTEFHDATCTEDGYERTVCLDCGAELAGSNWPADGHKFENGVCTVCGAPDPNYVAPEEPWVNPFKDVDAADWFYEGVEFANRHGLFQGTAPDVFSPSDPMTRAMLVTVLWRLDGKTAAAKVSAFVDVPANEWYTEAVAWAAENGIVNGMDATHFAPDDEVTREQIATILFRYAEKRDADTSKRADLTAFPDAEKVSDYAKEALAWANAAALIKGTNENGKDYLAPTASATRAQVATILARYAQSIVK